ncbi:MAG: dihydropyrimidinase [Candidatus Cloacimonetes bacterium 4572_55]|nr:MAG: dihydropyrimidinase [Candidatus Cloacimonetes bacterium 4572_55]
MAQNLFDLVVKNGDVVADSIVRKLDIGVKDGKIVALSPEITDRADKIIESEWKMIFPGFIDPHTHMDIPIKETRSADDFTSGSIAAAFGGVTTILDFTVQDKGESLDHALQRRLDAAAGKSHVDFGMHINVTDCPDRHLERIPKLIQRGFSSFKTFSTYREAGMMATLSQFREILRQVDSHGGILMLHAEENEIIERLTKKYVSEGCFDPIYHARSRPPEAEAKAIEQAARIAGELNARLYIVHLSSRAGLESALNARRQGVKIYLETCPQYLLLTEDSYRKKNGHYYIASPPLRRQEDCEALWQALADGHIDTVGTDHCPFTVSQKDIGHGHFYQTPNGLPGVETLFPLLYTYGVVQGRISISRMVHILSKNSASIFGISDRKGEIAIGKDADLVIWNPAIDSEISTDKLHGAADWSPYDQKPIAGKIEHVILRGKSLIENGKFVGTSPAGQLLLT